MRPHRCRRMWGAAARRALKTPVRLVSTVSDHPTASSSKTEHMVETPALATRMSTEPERLHHLVDEGDHGVEVAHVGPGGDAPGALGLDQPHRLGQVVGRGERVGHGPEVGAPVDEGHIGALPGQLDGVAPALAAGPTGDDRHPAGELSGPVVCLLRHPASPGSADPPTGPVVRWASLGGLSYGAREADRPQARRTSR